MTSPHQDAADLVAELRDFIVDEPNYGKCLRMSIGAEHVERAANLIEQQAKALSEAEALAEERLQNYRKGMSVVRDLNMRHKRELADTLKSAANTFEAYREVELRALAAEARAEKAESALAEAVEVMRPFADEADGPTLCGAEMCDGWLPFLHRSYSEASISNGHLRAARAFVQQHQGKK